MQQISRSCTYYIKIIPKQQFRAIPDGYLKLKRWRVSNLGGTVEGLGEEQIEKLIAGLQRAIGKTP
jgi:hypothetical protein